MRLLLMAFIIGFVVDFCFAQQCYGPNCQMVPQFQQPPSQIYVPRTVYQPYQYRGTQVQPKTYRTPLRNLFFGRQRLYHWYAPGQTLPAQPAPNVQSLPASNLYQQMIR